MREVKVYAFAVGNINPLSPDTRRALKIIKAQEGLIGVKPYYPKGTLLVFKTENEAKRAKNNLGYKGIQTGTSICECYVTLNDDTEAGEHHG